MLEDLVVNQAKPKMHGILTDRHMYLVLGNEHLLVRSLMDITVFGWTRSATGSIMYAACNESK